MNTIRAIRKHLGVTQQAMADGIGCTQGNIGHYERGQTVPPDPAKRLLEFSRARGLDITLDQIYGLAPIPSTEPALAKEGG